MRLRLVREWILLSAWFVSSGGEEETPTGGTNLTPKPLLLRFIASKHPIWKWSPARGSKGRRRSRRDENESVRSAYGRGVGFYIGEPCQTTCSSIISPIYCNTTTGRCECLEKFPVNIDNKFCVKAAKLGDGCEYSDSCAFYDLNAVCHPEGECRCADGYKREGVLEQLPICMADRGKGILDNSDITTMVSVIAGLIVFTALFCLVLRLFSKARFRPPGRMANAGTPPVVLTGLDTSHTIADSRRPSRSSGSTEFLPGSRRASYTMLAPPSSLGGSRRASSASVRSQVSLRSHSSFRGYRTCRDVRRTVSSPADAHSPLSPNQPANHHSSTSNDTKETPLTEVPTPDHLTNHI